MHRPAQALVAALALLVAACSDTATAPDGSDPQPQFSHTAFDAVHSTSDVLITPGVDIDGDEVDDGMTKVGESRLVRNSAGATLSAHTAGLPAGAYTNWWVIFNDPAECSDDCGKDDVFVDGDPANGPDIDQILAAKIDVVFGTGHVVGGPRANFASHRSKGDSDGSLFEGLYAANGMEAPGLMMPMTAEVHLIIRYHGEAEPGRIPTQIHTVEADCLPPECVDSAFAVHK